MSAMNVGVRELKTRLSEYMQRVKAGQTIVITERGKPIGRIVPAERSLEERIQVMLQAGLAGWSGQKFDPPPPQVAIQGDRTVSDLLIEDRQ